MDKSFFSGSSWTLRSRTGSRSIRPTFMSIGNASVWSVPNHCSLRIGTLANNKPSGFHLFLVTCRARKFEVALKPKPIMNQCPSSALSYTADSPHESREISDENLHRRLQYGSCFNESLNSLLDSLARPDVLQCVLVSSTAHGGDWYRFNLYRMLGPKSIDFRISSVSRSHFSEQSSAWATMGRFWVIPSCSEDMRWSPFLYHEESD